MSKVKSISLLALVPVLALGGCARQSIAQPEGSLEPMVGQFLTDDSPVVIATATVTDPVAVLDEPGGITIGRLHAGQYPVTSTTGGWVQIGVDGVQAWVSASEISLAINQGQS